MSNTPAVTNVHDDLTTTAHHIGRWRKNRDGEWMVEITEFGRFWYSGTGQRHGAAEGDTVTIVKRDGTTVQGILDGSFDFPAVDSGLPNLYGARKAPGGRSARPAPLPEGVYRNAAGEYVRATTGDSGHRYGQVWDANANRFVYRRGALVGLTEADALDAAAAAEFGHAFHRCVFCARSLKRGESTDVGYGPDCADRYGLPWGVAAAVG